MKEFQLTGQVREILQAVAFGAAYAPVPGHILHLADVVLSEPAHDHTGADLPAAGYLRIDTFNLADDPGYHLAGFLYREQVICWPLSLHAHELQPGPIQVGLHRQDLHGIQLQKPGIVLSARWDVNLTFLQVQVPELKAGHLATVQALVDHQSQHHRIALVDKLSPVRLVMPLGRICKFMVDLIKDPRPPESKNSKAAKAGGFGRVTTE